MNILHLPTEILILIFDEMNMDILPTITVNKELYELSQERLFKMNARQKRKKDFFIRCTESKFWYNGFHGVQTLEECDFLHKAHNDKFGSDVSSLFFGKARYTLENTYQVAAETWYKYLLIHDPKRV